jgi:hypothetical protein
MPRGGRRPGAGAPKGNVNALRNGKYSPRRAMAPLHGGRRDGAGAPHGNVNALRKGNHSHRMLMVYLYCRHRPDPRALAMLLVEAGFISLKTRTFNGDVPGVVAFLYHGSLIVPSPDQSRTIRHRPVSPPAPRRRSFNCRPSPPPKHPKPAKNAKKQTSIKLPQATVSNFQHPTSGTAVLPYRAWTRRRFLTICGPGLTW